jgi:hypothetical protein
MSKPVHAEHVIRAARQVSSRLHAEFNAAMRSGEGGQVPGLFVVAAGAIDELIWQLQAAMQDEGDDAVPERPAPASAEKAPRCRHDWQEVALPGGETVTACKLCGVPKSKRGRKAAPASNGEAAAPAAVVTP